MITILLTLTGVTPLLVGHCARFSSFGYKSFGTNILIRRYLVARSFRLFLISSNTGESLKHLIYAQPGLICACHIGQ